MREFRDSPGLLNFFTARALLNFMVVGELTLTVTMIALIEIFLALFTVIEDCRVTSDGHVTDRWKNKIDR